VGEVTGSFVFGFVVAGAGAVVGAGSACIGAGAGAGKFFGASVPLS
jgi:hypothetical protein